MICLFLSSLSPVRFLTSSVSLQSLRSSAPLPSPVSAVFTHQSPSSVFKLLVSFILCQILIVTISRSVPSSSWVLLPSHLLHVTAGSCQTMDPADMLCRRPQASAQSQCAAQKGQKISLWSFSCSQAGETECNQYQQSHQELSLSPRPPPAPQSPAPRPSPVPKSLAPISNSEGETITLFEYFGRMAARSERDQSPGTDKIQNLYLSQRGN